MYAAGTAVAPLLSTVTRPSGGKSAQVAYDPANGKVSQVTDQNGGAWKAGAPVASGSSQVYVGSVLSGRPADYWRLADAGGATQAANQVNGNRATYSAVTIGDTGGPFDDTTVARFNGTSSYLKLPASDVPNSQPTSVSMWFNMPAGSVAGGVLFGYQGNDIGGDPNAPGAWVPALYVGTNGKLHGHFWIEDIRKIMSSPAPVNDGKWHHVVLAASGNSQSLYLDGARIGGPVNAARIDNSVNNAYIGAGKWSGPWPSTAGPVGYFPGQIAEVAFYKSQLTDPQVSAQFNARAKSAGAPIKTVTVTDPAGKKLSYVYDAMTERKVADVDALGNKTQYGYDVGGFLRTVTDPNGNVTTTEHDVRGNTVSQTTCQNQPGDKCSTIYYTYYPDATTRALSPDPRNDVLLTVRDGRSSSATDNTYLTSYAYDAKGNRTTVTDPLGRVTSTGYTDGTAIAAVDGGAAPAGLPSTLATPGGAKQVVEYFKSGDIAKVTDPAGKVTAFSYDGLGRLLTKTEVTDTFPAGLVTRYSYDGQGRVVTQQEPPVTNRVTGAVHTPVTTVTYDVDGLVTSRAISDPTGGDAPRQVSSTFNEFGQEATSTDAAGKVVRIEYDAYGNPVKETDADGGITTTSYDPEGRLLTSTLLGYTGDPNDPSPATSLVVTSRAYDPAGRLASVTDAMGWVTSYTYTDNGLTAKVTRKDPGTGAVFTQEGNTYDAAGNLVSQVTNDGATTTTYAVDAASRTTSTTLDPNGLRRTTDLTLSADDTVVATRISDGSGTVARTEATYDPMGRVTSRTVFNDGSGRPAGWWKLNETSGSTARDSSTAGRSATLTTGVTWADGAAVFSGNGSAVATSGPVLDTTKSYSVSAWVKANALNNWSGIVGQEAVRNSGFHLQWIPGENRWAFTQVPADVDESPPIRARSTTPASLGVWTHLIGVYDSSTGGMSLYVNGVKEGNATNATPIASNGPLTLGHTKYSASTFDRFNGSISNVQVYQRVISAADASELFANGRAGAALETDRLTTSWAVDKGGLPRSVTDPIGNATNYEYDEAGRAVVTVAPTVATEPGTGGAPVSTRPISYVGYNTFGERSETKDPKGNVTVVEYDAAGRVTATRLPAYTPPGAAQPITPVAKRAYDSLGQLVASTDPLGKETTYRYDQLGRVASVTAPNGGQTKFTYDLLGDQLSVTDPTGAVSTATYDYLGRRLTSTEVVRQDNKNYTTEYRYGPGGWLASVKSPAGVVGSTTYNAAGQPVTVTDGANNVTRYSYDGAGRVVRTTLPDGTDATASYDLAGRTVGASSYDAAGTVLRTQSSAYDANGNPTAVTDARGATTTFTYDATGLLTAQVEPVNGSDSITSTFGYDVAGNRTRFTDGRKNAFLTTYNNWNLPESRIEPATSAYQEAADRTFTYEYDAAGRMVTQRSPGGVRVTNSYDEVGNPIRQAGSGAEVTTADRAFGYDLAGRVTSAAGSAGETTLTYDDRGMPRSISGVAGAASFTYTADGALASRNDAAGTTGFSYDSAGRLATTSNSATGVNLSYAYDNLSQVSSIRYGPGGNTRTFSYDALHRLTADELKTATSAAVAKIAYGYDANDNLTSKTTSGFAGSATNTYTYDLANRLTSWNDGTKTTVYAYDRSGNRVQAGNRTFSYDERNQLQASSDGTTYQYTPRGTLKVTNTGSAKLTTAVDAFGQVTSQASAGSTQQYRYDGFGRVIRDGFAYSGLGNDLASDGANKYTRDPAGDVVGVATPTTKALAWTDLHTDVVGLFTDSGIVLTGSATYDPFGKVLATIGMVGSLGYQSEWTDAATGRVNMLARWYNPDTGQFDTRDSASNNPVPDSVNANRFAYANANPLTNTDPTGHWSLSGAWNKAKSGFNRAVNAAAYTVASGWNSFSSAVSAGYNWVKDKVDQGRQWVEQKIDQGRKWVEQKVDQGRKWVAEKANQIKQSAKNAYNTVKQAGKVVAAKYVRVVKQAVNHIKDAYNAAEKWVKDNKDMLIEIAAIAGAVLAGLACTAVTAGAGAVACMVGAAALINLAKDSAQGNIHNWGDAFGSLGTGALQGLAGGVGGIVGGKVAALAVGKLGGLAASVGGRMLSGGVSGGVGDAVTQFASTGRVSWGGVAASAGMGAVFGGFARGGGAKVGGGGGRSGAGRVEEPSPGRGRSSESSAGRCPTEHSFDPETRVLMDGGSSKAIKDVLFDDKVVATDPETGSTELKSVELLHVNHDTDLTDVTVKVGGGEKAGTSTVLHTTAHHPFWDQTAKKWVHAADLVVGHELRTYDGETATVTEVRNFAGGNDMYDLTVKDTHTYYVMAGNTPVLVHNCGDVTVSPAASDWATKGAHVHVGGNEVRVFPNGQGGVGAEPIRLSSGTATPRQVQRVLDCINSCASLRSDLISKASSAMDEMNNGGNWGNTINRGSEMHFLIKALEGIE
jgi:RHS repeat-associated protein